MKGMGEVDKQTHFRLLSDDSKIWRKNLLTKARYQSGINIVFKGSDGMPLERQLFRLNVRLLK